MHADKCSNPFFKYQQAYWLWSSVVSVLKSITAFFVSSETLLLSLFLPLGMVNSACWFPSTSVLGITPPPCDALSYLFDTFSTLSIQAIQIILCHNLCCYLTRRSCWTNLSMMHWIQWSFGDDDSYSNFRSISCRLAFDLVCFLIVPSRSKSRSTLWCSVRS